MLDTLFSPPPRAARGPRWKYTDCKVGYFGHLANTTQQRGKGIYEQ